jgi:hypothetical protein
MCKLCTNAYAKEYAEKHKDERKEYRDKYYEANKSKFAAYQRERRKRDPMFRLAQRMTSFISRSLRGTKCRRTWQSLVGYTLDDLKNHLEPQFLPGMSWENYGQWHIDHIVPIAAHRFTSPEDHEFKKCWSLSNLRPLWGAENRSKNSKYQGIDYRYCKEVPRDSLSAPRSPLPQMAPDAP